MINLTKKYNIKFTKKYNDFIDAGLGLLSLAVVAKICIMFGVLVGLATAGVILLVYGFAMNAVFSGEGDGSN